MNIIYCSPSSPNKTLWEKLKGDFNGGIHKAYTTYIFLLIIGFAVWFFMKNDSNADVPAKNRASKVSANSNRSHNNTISMYEDSRKQEMTSGDDGGDNGTDDLDTNNNKSKIEDIKRNEGANKVDVVADLESNVQQRQVAQAQPYQNSSQQYQGAQAQQYPNGGQQAQAQPYPNSGQQAQAQPYLNSGQPQVYANGSPYHGNQPSYAQPVYAPVPQYPPRPLYPPAGYPYGPRYGY